MPSAVTAASLPCFTNRLSSTATSRTAPPAMSTSSLLLQQPAACTSLRRRVLPPSCFRAGDLGCIVTTCRLCSQNCRRAQQSTLHPTGLPGCCSWSAAHLAAPAPPAGPLRWAARPASTPSSGSGAFAGARNGGSNSSSRGAPLVVRAAGNNGGDKPVKVRSQTLYPYPCVRPCSALAELHPCSAAWGKGGQGRGALQHARSKGAVGP